MLGYVNTSFYPNYTIGAKTASIVGWVEGQNPTFFVQFLEKFGGGSACHPRVGGRAVSF
jgi:hypothetical protein